MAPWVAISVTLVIFFLCQLIASVWWASRVNTILELMQHSLKVMSEKFEKIDSMYYSKEDAIRDSTVNDKEHQAMWKKLDALAAMVSSFRIK